MQQSTSKNTVIMADIGNSILWIELNDTAPRLKFSPCSMLSKMLIIIRLD